MKQSTKDQVATFVKRELDLIPGNVDFLPMVHAKEGERTGRISYQEWQQWVQRLDRQRRKEPKFDENFRRVPDETVDRAWTVLNAPLSLEDAVAPTEYEFMDHAHCAERIRNARAGVATALALFVQCGLRRERVTFMDLVDSLAAAFSPHYLKLSSVVTSAKQMTLKSLRNCRRDLVLRGVHADRIWDAVINLRPNPLFRIQMDVLGHDTVITPKLRSESLILAEFQNIIPSDSDGPSRGHRLKIVNCEQDALAVPAKSSSPRRVRRNVCGEYPYNVVQVSEKAEHLLNIQEGVVLSFDVDAFNADYRAAEESASSVSADLRNRYGVRADLSTLPRQIPKSTKTEQPEKDNVGERKKEEKKRRWSMRAEHVFYRSIALAMSYEKHEWDAAEFEDQDTRQKYVWRLEKLKTLVDETKETRKGHKRTASVAMSWLRDLCLTLPNTPEELYAIAQKARPWRFEVIKLLNQYDAAKLHLASFAGVREQVKRESGLLPIGTGFGYVLSRRFQPEHLWPTHVTSKRSWVSTADEEAESDVGALPSEEEATSLRRRWFKWRDPATGCVRDLAGFDISSSQMQILATLLGDEELESITMRRESSFKEYMAGIAFHDKTHLLEAVGKNTYSGPKDERLHKLVKETLMRVSYGSRPGRVAYILRQQPHEFGPGWAKGRVDDFIRLFGEKHPKVALFLEACNCIAKIAIELDPCRGVIFRNPLDQTQVRWNPIKSKRVHVDFSNKKAYLRVPAGEPNNHREYPVNGTELGRLVMPCLVHMLDAYYSGLVMENLHKQGCPAFVGIHDCWLVPENQLPSLCAAMKIASAQWYAGLGSIYEDLDRYLGFDQKYADLIASARKLWEKRRSIGDVPIFKAKPTKSSGA